MCRRLSAALSGGCRTTPRSAARSVGVVVILPLVVLERNPPRADDVVEDAANSAANLCVWCKDGKERDRHCTETTPPHFLGCCVRGVESLNKIVGSAECAASHGKSKASGQLAPVLERRTTLTMVKLKLNRHAKAQQGATPEE